MPSYTCVDVKFHNLNVCLFPLMLKHWFKFLTLHIFAHFQSVQCIYTLTIILLCLSFFLTFFVCLTVITGTVITAVMREGSMYATVSIINVYKEGSLAIQQAGKTMSTKIIILCKKCPFIRRGKCW